MKKWSRNKKYNYTDEVKVFNSVFKYAGEDGTNTEESPHIIFERDKKDFPIWVKIGALKEKSHETIINTKEGDKMEDKRIYFLDEKGMVIYQVVKELCHLFTFYYTSWQGVSAEILNVYDIKLKNGKYVHIASKSEREAIYIFNTYFEETISLKQRTKCNTINKM